MHKIKLLICALWTGYVAGGKFGDFLLSCWYEFVYAGAWCAKDHKKFWSPTNTADLNYFEILNSDSASEEFKSATQNPLNEINRELDTSASTSALHTQAKDRTKDVSTLYRLHGVVNHLGIQASGGHFVTNILNTEDDTWTRCDDSLVMDVSSQSYLMFFMSHGWFLSYR